MHLKHLIAALALMALTSSCNGALFPENATKRGYDGNAVYNYALGRQYQAEGRFELARQHLVLALAMADDENFRNVVATEIESTDKALRSLR